MTLQDVYRAIRTATTPDGLDRAENAAARHTAAHPEDEPLVAAAMEMLCMRRESIDLYGPSPCPTPVRLAVGKDQRAAKYYV